MSYDNGCFDEEVGCSEFDTCVNLNSSEHKNSGGTLFDSSNDTCEDESHKEIHLCNELDDNLTINDRDILDTCFKNICELTLEDLELLYDASPLSTLVSKEESITYRSTNDHECDEMKISKGGTPISNEMPKGMDVVLNPHLLLISNCKTTSKYSSAINAEDEIGDSQVATISQNVTSSKICATYEDPFHDSIPSRITNPFLKLMPKMTTSTISLSKSLFLLLFTFCVLPQLLFYILLDEMKNLKTKEFSKLEVGVWHEMNFPKLGVG